MKLLPHTLSVTCIALAAPVAADGLSHLPLMSDISAEAVAISPHVPNMGTHWANPADLPLGPIYCVIDGRVVCVEYMFLASELAAGTEWTAVTTGLQTPPVTWIDMEYRPDGAGPFQEPLYQLHLYFADREVLAVH